MSTRGSHPLVDQKRVELQLHYLPSQYYENGANHGGKKSAGTHKKRRSDTDNFKPVCCTRYLSSRLLVTTLGIRLVSCFCVSTELFVPILNGLIISDNRPSY